MVRTIPLSRGAFCISIDMERLWGVWDKVSARDAELCAALEGPILNDLLALFRRYDVPATWAIVGRLLSESPDLVGRQGSRDCWYAPELADSIRREHTPHEVGSHSFEHVFFHDVGEAEAKQDLQRAKAVHAEQGLPFQSFVFPRNQVKYLDALASVGLRVFRSTDAGLLGLSERHLRRARPIVNLAEKALALTPPLVWPLLHPNGLVELPSSMLLIGRNGLRRVVRPAAMERKVRAGLRAASERRGLFHLWFHPSNFYHDRVAQLGILAVALEEAGRLRAQGVLDVRTMGSFAQPAPHTEH
jgi:hypothetical protein